MSKPVPVTEITGAATVPVTVAAVMVAELLGTVVVAPVPPIPKRVIEAIGQNIGAHLPSIVYASACECF
ncbi:MAG: hypothetical protein ACRDX8_02175 [Acidimicrobiales bacterium]